MLRRVSRLARDRSGLAAVEFAMILPVMLILFFGIFETSQALSARADVVNLTSAAADLVAQSSAPTAADIQNVYAATTTMLSPFSVAGDRSPAIRITSIIDDGLGQAPRSQGIVSWVCTLAGGVSLPGATPTKGATVVLPSAMILRGYSVIRVEVAYKYVSPTTQSITGPIVMTSSFYTKPRRTMQIAQPTGSCNA
jgi:Flp pilus assembly protein TadG